MKKYMDTALDESPNKNLDCKDDQGRVAPVVRGEEIS